MKRNVIGGRATPRRTWWMPALLASVVLASAPALADGSTSQATAELLFEKGRKLVLEGKLEEACRTLAESEAVDPASGTLLLLAECYRRAGKPASQWLALRQVLSVADREQRPNRIADAKRQIADVEKDLPYLAVRLAPGVSELPDLVVERDGEAMKAGFGVETPVDPGKHRVTARAKGYKPVVVEVAVAAREHKTVEVPVLVPEPAAPPPVPPPRESGSVGRTVGIVVGGLGLGGVAVGALFGGLAKQTQDQAKKLCPASPCSNEIGLSRNATALTYADTATVSMSAGAGLVAIGVLLFALAPKSPAKPADTAAPRVALTGVSPVVTRSGGGVWLDAAF